MLDGRGAKTEKGQLQACMIAWPDVHQYCNHKILAMSWLLAKPRSSP